MRNRISAVIIDPEKEQHNYDDVKVSKLWDIYEDGFDLNVIKDTKNIYEKLSGYRGYDCIITIGNDIDFTPLNDMPFYIRRKWIHKDTFNAQDIAYSIIAVFKGNIGRETPEHNKTFSVFTCTFNTTDLQLRRLYNSIKAQTYPDWNWYILDDSRDDETVKRIRRLNDPRIIVYRNYTNHGSIGFNKHSIAMLCDGDYLVEVDHDDELLPDCLSKIKEAFDKYPDADFAYSYVLEDIDGNEVWYGDDWGKGGWGGGYLPIDVKGRTYNVALQSDITPISIRTIFTQPNHVRCWRRGFYHSIGGHNPEFSVLDDAEILIRTFLNGKMIKIPEVLYIQHESGDRGTESGTNTQSLRFKEIQRTTEILLKKYDTQVHERIEQLGYTDCIWDHNIGQSNIHKKIDEPPVMNYIL